MQWRTDTCLCFCFSQVDKFLPLYKRKKPQALPVVFESIPSSGTLGPGEQVDVEIKFCPTEGVKLLFISNIIRRRRLAELTVVLESFSWGCWPSLQVAYTRRLIVSVADNTQQTFVTACGQAEEPQLQFCPSVLDLGACLPSSTEAEAEVIVKNLSSFPIEFYSLEMDKQYLEEEKVLQFTGGLCGDRNVITSSARTVLFLLKTGPDLYKCSSAI